MKKIILVRYGEIILKGLNRPVFEGKLVTNIKVILNCIGKTEVIRSQGRIYVEPCSDEFDYDRALKDIKKAFGIVSVSLAWKIKSDFEEIKKHAVMFVEQLLKYKNYKSFKIETKRGNKSFAMSSPEISRELGAVVFEHFDQLDVDVNNPDFILYIEVRESSYIYSEIEQAFGGLPTGTNGKALLLLSGGIDSPVAGWMMAKRGVEIGAVHFYSYPYTSERSKDKVIDLAKTVSEYCANLDLHIVPFTKIQEKINEKFPQELSTIIMRRLMMRIAELIAKKNNAAALITGESMGQVASQTMEGLVVTNDAVKMPVFRPLIGMDKYEVIDIARKIETYETSILPYEDCCTVFVAKHPKIRPKLKKVMEYESKVDFEQLILDAVADIEVIHLSPYQKNK